jgi:hypothetical protein
MDEAATMATTICQTRTSCWKAVQTASVRPDGQSGAQTSTQGPSHCLDEPRNEAAKPPPEPAAPNAGKSYRRRRAA